MNETLNSIMERRSIRAYTDVPLTEEQTEQLANAALASPTAVNDQNWHFTFVTDQKLINEIEEDTFSSLDKDAAMRMKLRGGRIFYGAPLVIFISADKSKRWSLINSGIAVENLAIAAQGMGLGSVIIGMVQKAFDGENGKKYSKALSFPEGYEFTIAIAVGNIAKSKEAHGFDRSKLTFI